MKRVIIFLLLVFCTGCSAEMTEEDVSKMHFVKAGQEVGGKMRSTPSKKKQTPRRGRRMYLWKVPLSPPTPISFP